MQNRRTILLISASAIIVLVLVFGYRWLQQGRIEITTNSKESKIFLLHEDKEKKQIGTGEVTRRLWHGNYTIQVEETDKQSRTFIHVNKRRTSSKQVDLREPAQPEKVANISASDIVSNGDVVRFFNPTAQMLGEISAGQEPKYYLPDLYPVNEVRWVDFNSALVTSDGTRMMTIKNGEIQSLELSGIEVDEGYGLPADYSVNSLGDIAYTNGKTVYFGNLFTRSYKKVYEAASESIEVSLSNSGSVLVYGRSNDTSHEQPDGVVAEQPLAIIDAPTGTLDQPAIVNKAIERSQWSPDGTKLLLFGGNTTVYEPSSRITREFLSIRPSNTNSFVWLNNQLIAYVDGGVVWAYSLRTDITYKIGRSAEALVSADVVSTIDEQGNLLFGSSPDTSLYGDVGVLYRLKLPDLN